MWLIEGYPLITRNDTNKMHLKAAVCINILLIKENKINGKEVF